MYRLSVVMFQMAILLLGYSAVLLCIVGGWPGWVALGLVAMVALKHKGKQVFTTLGSARLSTEEEMRQAEMMDGKGVILGRLPKKKLPQRIKALFSPGSPKSACTQFLGTQELITLPPSTVHVSCYGRTGSGKGASLILPWLLSVNESAVVVDIKGDLAMLTAEHRKKMGHRIIILDPFKVVTQ